MARKPKNAKRTIEDSQVPDFFLVGGHRIELEVDPTMSYDLHGLYHDKKISINPFHKEVESTILHELLHAALDISAQNEHLNEDQEEALVRSIENMIGHLLTVKGVNI